MRNLMNGWSCLWCRIHGHILLLVDAFNLMHSVIGILIMVVN